MVSSISYSVFTAYFFVFLSIFFVTSNGFFYEELTEGIAIKRTEKTSHLHFYFHDIVGGKNPTAVKIAGPLNSTGYGFGSTLMMDDALTEGPERTSKLVGRAQGLYAIAAQEDVSLLMVVNFAFMEGEYNGSSISILGRNPVLNDVREMPIVGGSGLFRFASGYALAHTIWFDSKTGDATVEYNVYVTTNEVS
ncbi:dirigent protein 22-like [Pistacia vera]|uniref:dirigent protein 22-like n=1 Tax=Pistacia vera TaxID=55513 RepID=UPI0012632721|nr:dirigent protein 22-like [Pistacia vera]